MVQVTVPDWGYARLTSKLDEMMVFRAYQCLGVKQEFSDADCNNRVENLSPFLPSRTLAEQGELLHDAPPNPTATRSWYRNMRNPGMSSTRGPRQ